MSDTQTPVIDGSPIAKAIGHLGFLRSVIRSGEQLSPDEEDAVSRVVIELRDEAERIAELERQLAAEKLAREKAEAKVRLAEESGCEFCELETGWGISIPLTEEFSCLQEVYVRECGLREKAERKRDELTTEKDKRIARLVYGVERGVLFLTEDPAIAEQHFRILLIEEKQDVDDWFAQRDALTGPLVEKLEAYQNMHDSNLGPCRCSGWCALATKMLAVLAALRPEAKR